MRIRLYLSVRFMIIYYSELYGKQLLLCSTHIDTRSSVHQNLCAKKKECITYPHSEILSLEASGNLVIRFSILKLSLKAFSLSPRMASRWLRPL